ncbi:hypothetical protein DFH06DRAFT_1326717 [Mycena polygramma]|nr:hypothetical protein DFH06DRAFT_1326717 [Mycena polygramma]
MSMSSTDAPPATREDVMSSLLKGLTSMGIKDAAERPLVSHVKGMLFAANSPSFAWVPVALACEPGIASLGDVGYRPWITFGVPEHSWDIDFERCSARIDYLPGRDPIRLKHSYCLMFPDQGNHRSSFDIPLNSHVNAMAGSSGWRSNLLVLRYTDDGQGFASLDDADVKKVMVLGVPTEPTYRNQFRRALTVAENIITWDGGIVSVDEASDTSWCSDTLLFVHFSGITSRNREIQLGDDVACEVGMVSRDRHHCGQSAASARYARVYDIFAVGIVALGNDQYYETFWPGHEYSTHGTPAYVVPYIDFEERIFTATVVGRVHDILRTGPRRKVLVLTKPTEPVTAQSVFNEPHRVAEEIIAADREDVSRLVVSESAWCAGAALFVTINNRTRGGQAYWGDRAAVPICPHEYLLGPLNRGEDWWPIGVDGGDPKQPIDLDFWLYCKQHPGEPRSHQGEPLSENEKKVFECGICLDTLFRPVNSVYAHILLRMCVGMASGWP